jgi:energy-coupling factor transport system permease protein
MTVVLDTYVAGTSFLHRLDPRVKLWALTLALVLAFLLPGLLSGAAFLLAIHVVLRLAGVPWPTLFRFWRKMGVIIVLILLLQPFARPLGPVLFAVGPLRFTVGGIINALSMALRTLNVALLVAGLLFTTEHRVLIQGLVSLGIPYTWGLTISLSLRFLPAVQSLFQTVRDAQAARGWVAEGGFFRRVKEYLPILVAVLIGTLRMSDDLTLALAARGLGVSERRTIWRGLKITPVDWVFAIGVTVAFGLFVLWRSLT